MLDHTSMHVRVQACISLPIARMDLQALSSSRFHGTENHHADECVTPRGESSVHSPKSAVRRRMQKLIRCPSDTSEHLGCFFFRAPTWQIHCGGVLLISPGGSVVRRIFAQAVFLTHAQRTRPGGRRGAKKGVFGMWYPYPL